MCRVLCAPQNLVRHRTFNILGVVYQQIGRDAVFHLEGSSGCMSGKLNPTCFWVIHQIHVLKRFPLGEVRKINAKECECQSSGFLQFVSTDQLWPCSVSTEQLWLSAVCVHRAAVTFCSVSTEQLWLPAVCPLTSCDSAVCPLSSCDFLQGVSTDQLW